MTSEHVEPFLRSLDAPETRRAYRYDLSCFFDFLAERDGPVAADEISPDDTRRFFRHLEATSLSPSTKRRRVTALRSFFDWLRSETGLVAFNPVQDPPSFSADSTAPEEAGPAPDRDMLRRLLDQMDRKTLRGQRDYTLVLTIVYGALRRAEVASLDVDDVRPLGRHWVIDLPVSSQPRSGYIPIPDAVAEQVQRLADLYDEPAGPLWRSLGNRNRGGRLSPDAIYKVVRRAGQAAGLDAPSIEGLRRAGLRLASLGGATLSQLRDHARLSTTASAAKYTAEDDRPGRLSSSVSARIPLNID